MDKNTSHEIRMDSVMTTKMYCDDQVMAVEYLFLGNMTKAQRWSQSRIPIFVQCRGHQHTDCRKPIPMNTQAQQEIIEEFALFDDWMDKASTSSV